MCESRDVKADLPSPRYFSVPWLARCPALQYQPCYSGSATLGKSRVIERVSRKFRRRSFKNHTSNRGRFPSRTVFSATGCRPIRTACEGKTKMIPTNFVSCVLGEDRFTQLLSRKRVIINGIVSQDAIEDVFRDEKMGSNFSQGGCIQSPRLLTGDKDGQAQRSLLSSLASTSSPTFVKLNIVSARPTVKKASVRSFEIFR